MKMSSKTEKHLFLSDFQIPEHDERAIDLAIKIIPDLKPDFIHFPGDILDLTKQSSFVQNPYDKHTLMDEIRIARKILKKIVDVARKANKNCKFYFYFGNHEERLLIRIANKVPDLAELVNDDGDYVLNLSTLLGLKNLGIIPVPYYKTHKLSGGVRVEHGDIASTHAGATGVKMILRRGSSGVSGHTHRLALTFKTQGDTERFWIENGSLCKRNFTFPYLKEPDWMMGFSIVTYANGVMHPCLIPIINYSFVYGGKLYKG